MVSNGIWLLFGLISFLAVEKFLPEQEQDQNDKNTTKNYLFFKSIRVITKILK